MCNVLFPVVDSMGRLPSPGLLEGLTSDFGDFDECLDSKTPEHTRKQFEGKYCLLNIKLPYPDIDPNNDLPLDNKLFEYYHMEKISTVRALTEGLHEMNGTIFNLGICMPSVCTPDEISAVLNKGDTKVLFLNMLNNNFFVVLYPVTNIPLDVDRKCSAKSDSIILDKFQLGSM